MSKENTLETTATSKQTSSSSTKVTDVTFSNGYIHEILNKREKTKKDWMKVLELMYENDIIVDPTITAGWVSDRELNQSISPAIEFYNEIEPRIEGNIELIIDDLEEIGFVKVNRNTNYSDQLEDSDLSMSEDTVVPIPGLTQEGLQFAHNLKTERQQQTTNRYLLALTFLLFVLTLVLVGLEIVPLL
ncbi:hypothetical protein [Halorubrum trueperi]|uniref:Uncharacterized protein n=1 Tax=Halorubrum trueperi TaxID=2004704 RepID=A0ABD5UGH1_9EURY